MIRKTGNRAFHALNRILSLPGSQALGSIDISVAQPTLDLGDIVRASVMRDTYFYAEKTVAGVGRTDYNARPWTTSDWDVIAYEGQAQANPEIIPNDHDIIVYEWGAQVDTPANFAQAQLARKVNYGISALFAGSELLMWNADTTRNDMLFDNDCPGFVIDLPWMFLPDRVAGSQNLVYSLLTQTGGLDHAFYMRTLSAPPGVFSPRK